MQENRSHILEVEYSDLYSYWHRETAVVLALISFS